jgi:CPA1 family monovalent cation:H+ antiporter
VPAPLEIVALLVAATALAGAANRFGVFAPLLLTPAGIAASYLPGVPDYPLNPALVLGGFLPPLLYATALRTPVHGIRRSSRKIALLSVALVLVTAFAVAGVARLVMPALPFAAALALGAVVAPPDAVAATAVARRVGMPRRMVSLLESESLLNDATALVTLRTAVAGLATVLSLTTVAADFAGAVVVGVAVGWLVAAGLTPLRRRLQNPVVDTTLSLLVPYAAYFGAEELRGSGVLAVVVAGVMLGHRAPDIQSAPARVTERTIWRSVQFLLESLVFLLIGLQLRGLIERTGGLTGRSVMFCAAVLVTVVVVRVLWVFPALYVPQLSARVRRREPFPQWQAVAVVSWAGMRGVVTLAAAFGLPSSTPQREVLQLAAFGVVAGTLLLQAPTLPVLVRRLGLAGPDPGQDALLAAQVVERASLAGLARLDEVSAPGDDDETVESLRTWGRRTARAAWERLGVNTPQETPAAAFRRLRVSMLEAERRVVVDARRSGDVAHEVLEPIMERLDQEEAMLVGFAESVPPAGVQELVAGPQVSDCVHLRCADPTTQPRTPGVCQGCQEIGEHNWVHLRTCLQCGFVGCCDSSPNRHATKHFEAVGHPVIRSQEPGEAWRWCYLDQLVG